MDERAEILDDHQTVIALVTLLQADELSTFGQAVAFARPTVLLAALTQLAAAVDTIASLTGSDGPSTLQRIALGIASDG